MKWYKQQHGPIDHHYIVDEERRFVASMDNEATEGEWNLATAAPDLFAACQAAVATTGGSEHWQGETRDFLLLAEAAIRKATGQPLSTDIPYAERTPLQHRLAGSAPDQEHTP